MPNQQLTTEAMALPISERVMLAQTLWQSIQAGLAEVDEQTALREAVQRDEELSSGTVTGRTHEEVMRTSMTIHEIATAALFLSSKERAALADWLVGTTSSS